MEALASCNRTVLYLSCQSGRLELINAVWMALERRGLVHILNTPTSGGVTPLMAAVMSNSEQAVTFCLDIGMDVHARDFLGKSCLDYVVAQ